MKKSLKKVCSMLLAAVLLVSALPLAGIDFGSMFASAFVAVYGETEDFKYSTEPINSSTYGGVTLYQYKGSEKNVVIPSEIDGMPVTVISCFKSDNGDVEEGEVSYDCSNVETVVVPDSVRVIGVSAFSGAPNLKSVTLSEGLEEIGDNAFDGCTQLKEIDIPETVYNIGNNAFRNCGVEEITLGIDFKYLRLNYFNSSNIKKITLNAPEVEFANFIYTGSIEEIVCNGLDISEDVHENVAGTISNSNFKLICNSAINLSTYLDLIAERGLYPHFDDENGVITFTNAPVDYGAEYVSGDYRYYLNAQNEAVISRYLGTDSNIAVPEILDGYNVTEIGAMAFMAQFESSVQIFDNRIDTKQITSITLPETIEKIGALAFGSNQAITSIDLPDAIINIPAMAFRQCSGLTSIDWPANLQKIGPAAFYLCNSLTELTVPDGVTQIGAYAISRCKLLESVTLPETLTKLGGYAFSECESLVSAALPDSIVEIGNGIFSSCYSLESVKLPEGIKSIGAAMFSETVLKEIVIPDSVTEIESDAFVYVTTLKNISFPENLRRIGKYAFMGCGFTELELPSKLESIGSYAFSSSKIKNLMLNCENLKAINEDAFFSCVSLESVEIAGGTSEIRKNAFSNCTKLSEVIFGDNVRRINGEAFANCTSLESITIPKNMEFIGEQAFESCTALKTVYLNAANCKVIAKYEWLPFDDGSLTDLYIGETVDVINSYMFYFQNALENVTFAEGLTKIDSRAFGGCASIKRVILPDTVETIGDFAFLGCSGISQLSLPNSITSIGKNAFAGCSSIKSVDLPDNLAVISEKAFINCTSLESVVLPDSLQTIGASAFENCTALVEITIPENMKQLYLSSFENCESLKTVYYNAIDCALTGLSETEVEGVYYSPFITCTSLENIILSEEITAIPDYFFCGLESISVVDIPASVTSFGKAAFAFSSVSGFTGCENLQKAGDYCFYGCKNLGALELPDRIIDIGAYTFAHSSIAEFTASNTLESIGENAFYGCESLSTVDLGTNVMLIGDGAFEGCTALTQIIIPDSVKNIGDRVFYGNTALKSVKMSANTVFIPDECFNFCSALSEFTWSASSKLIGRLAFGNCESLFTFDFVGIEKLYENSFYKSGVGVVTLGEALNNEAAKLEEVEVQSFMDCDSLETVSIGGNVSTVKSQAFANCDNLETAMISDNVTEIAEDAFDGCDNLTIYCSETSYAYSYAQTQGIRVSTFVIAAIPNQTYTGYEIKPDVNVSMSGKSLTQNIDFTVTFSDNINVGTARVKVNGSGDYRMFASSASFSIVTLNITNATLAGITEQAYTGSPVEPQIVLTYNGKVLKEGRDYTVIYEDNVEPGEATAVIKGTGNYSGGISAKFDIAEQSVFERIAAFFNSLFAAFLAWLRTIVPFI